VSWNWSLRKRLTRDLLAGYFRNMALILYKASSDGANTVNGSERLSFSTIMSAGRQQRDDTHSVLYMSICYMTVCKQL